MITELLLSLVKMLLISSLNAMPTFYFDLVFDMAPFLAWFSDILSVTSYFLPVADFLIIFGIWVAIHNTSIIWRVMQRVWDALPFT